MCGPLPALLALLLAGRPVAAQVDSNFQGLSPPVHKITLLVDTAGEDPPVYNGVAAAPLPAPGDLLDVQLYLPEAAGRSAFGFIIQFDDADSAFTGYFTIEQARGWTTVVARDATGQENLKHMGLEAPLGSAGPARFILFPRPVPVSVTGLLATFQIRTTQAPPGNRPLRFGFTAAIHSTTPPARLWHYKTRHAVTWR